MVAAAHDRDTVVSNIRSIVDRARAGGVPVVWVQDSLDGASGTPDWQIVPELAPAMGEPVVHKDHGDAFEATDLEQVLAAGGIGHLVVTGAQTDACIRSTIHGAFTRGYDVTLVGDAHTTEDHTAYGAPAPADVIAHTNLYWQHQDAPGRTASVVATADVTF